MSAALYSQLQHVALTGTRRFPLSKLTASFTPSSRSTEQALYCALTQTDTPEPLRLLRAVAIAAVSERATWQPAPVSETAQQTISPAPAAPSFTADLVQQIRPFLSTNGYNDDDRFLCIALLHCLREAQQSLPSELLVQALELGSPRPGYSTDTALRPYLSPVLGARGNWLAQQNPRWQWAAWLPGDQDNETLWQHGTTQQRQALLLEERKTHPDVARERLMASFEQMNSKERTSMLKTLATNLSMNDEPFLESLLQRTDRKISNTLREEIIALLDKLPQSRHSQRIMAIVRSLLHQDEKGQWHIEAPEDFDPAWKHDGIFDKNYPVRAQNGRRGAYLSELVEHTPLSFWTQTTGMSPNELFKWAAKTIWKQNLYRGWITILERDTDQHLTWITAHFDGTNGSHSRRHNVFLKLSQSQRETLWLECSLTQLDFMEIEYHQRLSDDGVFLSAELSQKLIKHIQLHAKRQHLQSYITSTSAKLTDSEKIEDQPPNALVYLNNVVIFLDESVLSQVQDLLKTHQELWSQYWPDIYQDICNKLEKRQKFLACQQAIVALA